MTFHENLANCSLWLWTETANHLWQSTLFLLLIFLIAAMLKKADAKSRYLVWLIASVKFAVPLSLFAALGEWLNLSQPLPSAVIIESPVSDGTSFINIVSSAPISIAISPMTQTAGSHNEIYCLLTLFWLAGCLSLFALWRKRNRAFKVALGYRNTPMTEIEADSFNNAQTKIGLTARVNFIVSDSILEPLMLGIWKSTVVMPKGLSQKLTGEEFELVVMHELAHVARRDNLVGVLQMVLCCLLWFHPLVWLVKRKLLEERERACDEAVVRLENKPQVYASGLMKVVQHGLHLYQSAGVAKAASSNLRKRLEIIMKNENTKTKWQKLIVVSAFGALILACIFAGLITTQASGGSNDSQTGNEGVPSAQAQIGKPVSYRIVQADDAPLKITEATGREITNREYAKLTGQTTVKTGIDGKPIFPNVYSAPEVKMVNNSGKTIVGFSVWVTEPRPNGDIGKMRGVIVGNPTMPRAVSIAPGQSYVDDFKKTHQPSSEKYWLEFTDPLKFYVTVVSVRFDDGTSWTAKEPKK